MVTACAPPPIDEEYPLEPVGQDLPVAPDTPPPEPGPDDVVRIESPEDDDAPMHGRMLPETAADIVARKDAPIELDAVEVMEYDGVKLDSVEDFRENSIKGPQDVDIETYRLVIDGLVNSPMSLSYDEVLDYPMYQKIVTLFCVEGWDAKILWEGILLRDLIGDADPKFTANTVIFHAVDGYTSSLPLDYVMDNNILLAYGMNGVTMPPERGFPFQVVAEQKWGYKWVRWVERVELSSDEDYEGFWEERGWDNEADLDEPPR